MLYKFKFCKTIVTKIVPEKIPALSDSESKKEEGKDRYH